MERSEKGGGRVLDCFLPGMITIDGRRGRYPAISITGRNCSLNCLHCKGYLLENMYHVSCPGELLETLRKLEAEGMLGVLLSGGCDREGRLPWGEYLPLLAGIDTSLYITAHAGLYVDEKTARDLGKTVIRQVLIDVVGDPDTYREIYRLSDFERMEETIHNLFHYGPEVIPHIVVGIHRGQIRGEFRALEMLRPYNPRIVTLVVLMPGIISVDPPSIEEVLEVFRAARDMFRTVALGCARPRGRYRYELEERLISEGLIDRMALWSDRALKKAEEMGYVLNFKYTCCSVG